MNPQKINYNITSVPPPGKYFVAHDKYDATALSQYSMNSTSKIVLMGEPAVGKTCLCTRFAFNEYGEDYMATVGAQFTKCEVKINGSSMTLQIWDVAGEKSYSSISFYYCRQTDIVLFCFDLTRIETFENLLNWRENFLNMTPNPVAAFLVGCKSDLKAQKEVSDIKIENFCKEYNMEYFSTSSKLSFNTTQLLERVAFYAAMNAQSSRTVKSEKVKISDSVVTLSEEPPAQAPKKKCCA